MKPPEVHRITSQYLVSIALNTNSYIDYSMEVGRLKEKNLNLISIHFSKYQASNRKEFESDFNPPQSFHTAHRAIGLSSQSFEPFDFHNAQQSTRIHNQSSQLSSLNRPLFQTLQYTNTNKQSTQP